MTPPTQHTILGDRYQLGTQIAVGGMGDVWRAEDTLLHRPVAVKILKTELSSDPTFLDRFRAEARTTASLSHSGIASVFDYGETTLEAGMPTAYLVMELVEGEPLSAILARERALTVERTLDIVGQAAAALQTAHQGGMVHRDIKPGNLMITPKGEVKITDFGVARVAYSVPLTLQGMVVGTAQYFSPEQAEGRQVGPASDIYSLGVVAYECLAGRLPFIADNPLAVAMMQIRDYPPPLPPHVPPPVRAVIERTMAKDPRFRYATGGVLAAALEVARAGGYDAVPAALLPAPPQTPVPSMPAVSAVAAPMPMPVGAVPMHPPPAQRRRTGVLAVVLLVLAIAVAAVIWLVIRDDDESSSSRPDPFTIGLRLDGAR